MTTFVLGGGCFWCLDAVFRGLKGVSQSECGYAGGHHQSPTYELVSSGTTGHAEVVRVEFDETVIPAAILLDIYFLVHDPTTPNRQGADVGTQYRSVILYTDDTQKDVFQAAVNRAQAHWNSPIVTEIVPLQTFHSAELYHQDYFSNNPTNGYCSVVIAPKIVKARHAYKTWFA